MKLFNGHSPRPIPNLKMLHPRRLLQRDMLGRITIHFPFLNTQLLAYLLFLNHSAKLSGEDRKPRATGVRFGDWLSLPPTLTYPLLIHIHLAAS